MADTIAQFEAEPAEFKKLVAKFIDGLISHFVLDDGRLVVAHAGMKESMQGRAPGGVRSSLVCGETTGETDELGLPVVTTGRPTTGVGQVLFMGTRRSPWPSGESHHQYRYRVRVRRRLDSSPVPGRRAREHPRPSNLRGGAQAPLHSTHEGVTAQQRHDRALDIQDVIGKRIVETRLAGNVTVGEENAAAALEVMSRFAVDPRWIIYPTADQVARRGQPAPDVLEHPEDAIAYYRKEGVDRVVCEEKHMGSRAILVVCKDEHRL